MSELFVENNSMIFCDDNKNKKVLFSYNNFMDNKSRIPFHTISDSETIISFLSDLIEKYKKLFNCKNDAETMSYFTIDCIIISELIKSAAPIKILEIGSDNGRLSYHLTELLGKVNPQSLVSFLSEEINSEGNNNWLNSAIMASYKPELSMHISDYDKTNLADDNFDIVIINGTVNFENPYKVIKEAERIIKKGGRIICYSANTPLLESCFRLVFSNAEEYHVSSKDIIITEKYNNMSWEADLLKKWDSELKKLLDELSLGFKTLPELEICREYVKKIEKYIEFSMNENKYKLKVNLINLNQTILDYIVHISDEYKIFYKDEVLKMCIILN